MADENALGSCGYHVIDEGDQYESDEDLEEIDEEEKKRRHKEMLKEFKEKMEREYRRK